MRPRSLGLHGVIQLTGSHPVLCLLALRFLQDIDWSRCGGEDSPFLVMALR